MLSDSLQFLGFGWNLVTGTLPQEFKVLTNLRFLEMSYTEVRGHLSDLLPFFPYSLNSLYVAFTDFRGDALSYQYSYSSRNLTHLDIRGLQDVTNIPTTVGLMSNLNVLMLGSNANLKGTLPSELALCTELNYLIVEDTSIEGIIPTELGNLAQLNTLILAFNQLHGTIPSEIARIDGLSAIVLTVNKLTGTVPTVLMELSRLELLHVNGNEGLDFPDELCLPGVEIFYSCSQTCTCCEDNCLGGYGEY